MWALDNLALMLEEQMSQEYESQWFPRRELQVDLMLTYARLAKLTETSAPQRSESYLSKAMRCASIAFPNETISKSRLFEMIQRVDEKPKTMN